MTIDTPTIPRKVVQGEKLRGADKLARIPVKVIPTEELPKKPDFHAMLLVTRNTRDFDATSPSVRVPYSL
jgi:hypothetical protein